MLATETGRCSAKSCGRPLDLQESSHNTHTPQHSAGPIDGDREGRVEERRDGWLKQRQRQREGRLQACRFVLLPPLGNRAWRTISTRRENSGSAVSRKYTLSDCEPRMTQVFSGGRQKLHERTKKRGFAFKMIVSRMRPDPALT